MDDLFTEAIQLIGWYRSEWDGDDPDCWVFARKVIDLLRVPCECDGGVDCGCSRRAGLIEEAGMLMKGVGDG